ncbi:fimbrial biogenesis chaperone [Tahibacter soli]|uniref:Fimbria/pilus periplasmic chaperone n=1 Tax=Tahibacter soli TaxID=2983605 RepID=A0A9X3YLR5_9GAMM|nr:fimbria/pilus periplasmic chaperone [Tahibacter soli]MDC8013939.1 fimbria/pilus periplasmic chaperone [Tahibacter soli]
MTSTRLRLVAAAFAALAAMPARAQGVAAAPVRLDIAADAKAQVLTLTNRGDAPADMQVRALRWTQAGADDAYAPTDDITVSPPRFTLAPAAQQVVRVYRRTAAPPAERAYRVFVDQIPGGDAAAPGTVRMPIRLVIPLFVAGTEPAAVALDWQAQARGDAIDIAVANRGDRHVRIGRLALAPLDGAPPADGAQLVYVLPGAQRTVALARPAWLADGVRAVRIVGDSDAGPIDARVDLAGAR